MRSLDKIATVSLTLLISISSSAQEFRWTPAPHYEVESDWGKVEYLGSNATMFFLLHRNWEGGKGQPLNYYAHVEGYSKTDLTKGFRNALNVPTNGTKSYTFVEGVPSEEGIHLLYSYFDKGSKMSVLSSALLSNTGELVGQEKRLAEMPGRNKNFSPHYHGQWNPVTEEITIIMTRPVDDPINNSTFYAKTSRIIGLSQKFDIIHDHEVELSSKRVGIIRFQTITNSGDAVIQVVEKASGKNYMTIVDMATGLVSRHKHLVGVRPRKFDYIDNDINTIEYIGVYNDSKDRAYIMYGLHEEIDNVYHLVGYHLIITNEKGEFENHRRVDVKEFSAADPSESGPEPSLKLFRERGVHINLRDELVVVGETMEKGKVGNVIVLNFDLNSGESEQLRCRRYLKVKKHEQLRYQSVTASSLDQFHLFGVTDKDSPDLDCEQIARKNIEGSGFDGLTMFRQTYFGQGLSGRSEIKLPVDKGIRRPITTFSDPDGFFVLVAFFDDEYHFGIE